MTSARPAYRHGKKLEAVTRVLAGRPAAEVATEMGIAETLVRKWEKYFVRAAARAVRYTSDEGETPTILDLQANAQRSFPTWVTRGAGSAICFFCARFFGRTDAIHLYGQGMSDVTVVDTDAERLAVMKEIYPRSWTFLAADAFETARQMRRAGRTFDLVISDHDPEDIDRVLGSRFEDFIALTKRHMVAEIATAHLIERGLTAGIEDINRMFSERHGTIVEVRDIVTRSSFEGGIHWLVLERP